MKILIIRFSSIGDIILTTPVIRCLKEQLNAEVHFLVRKPFAPVLSGNPHIDRLHLYDQWEPELIRQLKNEKFDHIFDLHKNLRSKRVIYALNAASTHFDKLNIRKWLMTGFKIDVLPRVHIVDRYFEAIEKFGVKYDGKGLDFFISEEQATSAAKLLEQNGIHAGTEYLAMAIGAARKTKLPPAELYADIIREIRMPVLLVGGPADAVFGEMIVNSAADARVINVAGKLSLQESVAVVRNARCLVTPDTGLMHAGVASGVPMVVIWGNTIPEFGMYPFYRQGAAVTYVNSEVKGLSCRPCSKIGYERCPKKHFNCMKMQNVQEIVRNIQLVAGR